MDYSKTLKNYIRKSGLSLSEISKQLKEKGFSTDKGYLSKLQNGKIPPAKEKLNISLAQILDVPSEKLINAAYLKKAPESVKRLLDTKQEENVSTLGKRTHDLKITPQYFEPVMQGIKPFEIRKNDRDYKVGDVLVLREWNGNKYTGNSITKEITYITDYEQQPGYIVMAIK